MVQFRTLRARKIRKGRITTLALRRTDFSLFRDLLGRIPGDMALESTAVQERWLLFKHYFKLKNGPSQHSGSQVKVAEGLHR